jgi:hypothetical protein
MSGTSKEPERKGAEVITITNEQQAWELLERAISQGMDGAVDLRFEGWPVFRMNAKGRDWNSTVPTRVMTPLLDVQKDINRSYASIRYGEGNLRKLKDEERDELEVVVKVSQGSSLFDAELWKHFSTIAQAAVGRMDGTQVVITVLGLALLLTAPVMYKAWLANKQKEKELDNQLQMSQEESRRMEIFAAAINRQPLLVAAQEDVEATQNRFLKAARPGDVLAVKGQALTSSEAASLAQSEREHAKDIVIDGVFMLLGNRTDKSDGFRITVRRLSDLLTINADVPIELPFDQQKLIQDAEWQKKKIMLTMNASVLREAISQAVVISAVNAPED